MKALSFIKDNLATILVIFCVLIWFGQCSTNRTLSKMNKNFTVKDSIQTKKIDSLISVINNNKPLTQKSLKKVLQNVMFEFTIYENDLDKGKTSLSDIKNKIEKDE